MSHSEFGKRTGLECMSLKTFITINRESLEEYYEEDFGLGNTNKFSSEQHGDTNILCLVDTSNNMFSTSKKPTIRRAGIERRRKVKHRYSYDNPLNRIHGFMIIEDGNNPLIPEGKNILSLSLICSSPLNLD